MIYFLKPDLILFAALAVSVSVAALLILKRSTSIRVFENAASLALSVIGVLALLATLAGPYREERRERGEIPVLLDISQSMDGNPVRELIENARQLVPAGVELTVLPFAERAGVSLAVESIAEELAAGDGFKTLQNSWSKLNVGATNLGQALDAAARSGSSNVLLISDGFETQGDLRAKLQARESGGSRIFPLVPTNSAGSKRGFRISALSLPLVAASEKSVEIRVSVQNTTAATLQGKLEVKHGEKVLKSDSVKVEPGRETLVTVLSDPSKEGITPVSATLTPDDGRFAPSTEQAFLAGEQRDKVLLISGSADDERHLKAALASQRFRLTSVIGGNSAAADAGIAGDLKVYKTIIFNNVALNQLPRGSAGRVEQYIKEGGGFIMVGGNQSFGLGGYRDSSLEPALPVDLVPPQTVAKRLNVAVALVIDKSRSMATGSRLDFAKEAARELIRTLKDDDYIGVIGFDSSPFVVVRMGILGQIRAQALQRVGLLYPAKRTSLLPALDEARRDLIRARAGRKHMIILTDGKIPDSGPFYLEIVKQMRVLGITVSTVLVGGEGDDGLLRNMAELGGGTYYETSDVRALPRLFISDVKVSTGERTLKEQDRYDVRAGPDGLKSTELISFPDLRGYVQTKRRVGATLELVTMAQEKAEPLLASWRYGKGQSIAFTSDANGRWSSNWVGWPRFQEFWSDLVESAQSSQTAGAGKNIQFDLRSYYERGTLNLDLFIFDRDAAGAVSAELVMPDQSLKHVDLQRIAPGRYRAELRDQIRAGRYEFRGKVGTANLTAVAFNLAGELFGERTGEGFNLSVLQGLADASGGKINPIAADLRDSGFIEKIRHDLSWLTLLIALSALLLEILRRERVLFMLARRRQVA